MNWVIVTIITSIISYSRMFGGFFQQDEWYGYSEFIINSGKSLEGFIKYFFAPSVVHYTPFTLIVLSSFFAIFGMNYIISALISLLLHLIVVVLVYFFLKEIFELKKYAGIGTFVFACFSSTHQATTWVMADIATHFSVIFGILSFIFLFKFLEKGQKSKIHLCVVFFLVSILFKEITLGLLLIMSISLLLYKSKTNSKNNIYGLKILIGFGILYILFRLLMIPFVKITPGSSTVLQSQSFGKIFYNFATLPIKAISQTIIPKEIVFNVSRFIAKLFSVSVRGEIDSPEFEIFVVKRVMEILWLLLSFCFVVFVLINNKKEKIIYFGFMWILINSIPFSFAPERSGAIFLIDSRNLYFVSIGSVIVMTFLTKKFIENKKILFLVCLILIVIINLYYLNINTNLVLRNGMVRKNILSDISTSVPKLSEKAIFYTESNQSYYGLPEETKILPFQSGFGQTLLGWYYKKEKFPIDFFKNRFLWEITDQGYKEFEGRGFGYYRDINLLKKAVKEYQFPKEYIYAFSWDSKYGTLRNISDRIRQEIYK